jgi:hypothetical protein
MLGLISLRFFAQSGHIDAFRSIVGEAERRIALPPLKQGFHQMAEGIWEAPPFYTLGTRRWESYSPPK